MNRRQLLGAFAGLPLLGLLVGPMQRIRRRRRPAIVWKDRPLRLVKIYRCRRSQEYIIGRYRCVAYEGTDGKCWVNVSERGQSGRSPRYYLMYHDENLTTFAEAKELGLRRLHGHCSVEARSAADAYAILNGDL